MDMVIERFNCPAMLMRLIEHARKRCIVESEAHSGGVGMWRNSNDGMHQLIQQPAMRDNQIAPGRSAQEAMQSLASAQKEDPVAFPHTANCVIGGDKCGARM